MNLNNSSSYRCPSSSESETDKFEVELTSSVIERLQKTELVEIIKNTQDETLRDFFKIVHQLRECEYQVRAKTGPGG